MNRFFLIALLMLSWTQYTPGQVAEDSPLGEVIDVRVVNVEVVVTDRQGNRVPDLTPADLRLLVDGKEVPIEFFTEVREGAAVRGAGAEGPTELPAPPGLTAGEAVGTSYLVFIDNLFPLARDRNQALRSIRQGLSLLNPEDRMAIAAFNGSRLEMLSSWSQSKEEISRILEQAESQNAGSFLYFLDTGLRADRAAGLGTPITDPATGAPLAAEFSFDEYRAQGATDQIETLLDRLAAAVNSTLRSFAEAPGRKVMLLLSGGWPNSPVLYAQGGHRGPVVGGGLDRGPRIVRSIYETANRVGYTLYPIDTAQQSFPSISAEEASLRDFGGVSRESQLHTTLNVLANETGGKALLDSARFTAMERVASDTRSYYWLGFTPAWKENDSSHKIRLKATRPGLKVRSREGFQDLSRKTALSYQVESALLMGFLPGSEPLQVELGSPRRKRRGRVEVPLSLVIPMDSIAMLPHRGQFVADLDLRVSALDESGDSNGVPVVPIRLAGPEPPAPGEHAVYETSILLKAENHDLVIALYDAASDNMLSAVETFHITKR